MPLRYFVPRREETRPFTARLRLTAPAEDPVGDDPGKRYHAWNRLSMISMPDAGKLENHDGTKGKFNGMVASLLVFLGAADFILTSAPSHYATLSDTLKAESDSSDLELTQYFGPMNLRIAHNDIINILLSIFSKFAHTKEFVHAEIIRKHGKFPATNTWHNICTAYIASTDFVYDATMKLLTLASSFNGDNWPSLDTNLD